MLNPNIEEKLARTVKELKELSVVKEVLLDEIYFSDEVDLSNLNKLPEGDIKWEKMNNPQVFTAANKYFWIKTSFDITNKNKHTKTFLSLEFGINGPSITIRPQGLLYLNGQIVQGIDIKHEDVLLSEGHYEMMMLFYTHDAQEIYALQASLKDVDERVYNAYFDFYCPLQAFKILDPKDDNYFKMSAVLEKACNVIDFRYPNTEKFYESTVKASEYLKEHFYNGICGSHIKVNVIGHSHIDVAWLWDYAQTREKVKRTFSTVLKLMDEYPEYKFMASTPQLYQFLKEDQPELYEKVKDKVKEGRWEVEGALWLECDCNLTSSESLIRQIVTGKRFFKDEFGVDSKVVWLPDVFGYSGTLPQIMKKAGVGHFVTAKIGWNDTNRFPYDTFIWKGIDGSEVNAYLISTPDQCNPRKGIYDITYTTYCPDVTASYILGTWHRYSQKDFSNTVFMTMGWGDGGGGPTREMLESQRRFSYGVPGIPQTSISTVKETIDEIKSNFDKNTQELHRLPVWNGELYFEYHRGTLTSVPMVKKYNRDSENLLLNCETSSILAKYLLNKTYEENALESNWKKTLLNQFHDVLPGSSIAKVYEDAEAIYNSLFSEITPIHNNNILDLANNVKGSGLFVYNSNSFNADGVVVVKGKTYVVNDIPSLGYKVIDLPNNSNNLIVKDKYLENQFYKITFNNDGSISSLFDKRVNRELVEKGQSINKLVAYEDMAYEYDNWELPYFHFQKSYPLDEDATFTLINDNQKVGFEIIKKYGNSKITQRICLYDNFERIDVECDLDWNEENQILKALFPVDLFFDQANYDIQSGFISRCSHSNNSTDAACFESVAHKYVDVSEKSYGFAILNNGKYGFNVDENVISISLIKSGSFPNEEANKIIPTFTYSLLPHLDDLTRSNVIETSYVLNKSLTAVEINNETGVLPSEYSFVKCLTDGVYIEAVKKALDSDDTIIRLYEGHKDRKQVTLSFAEEVSEVYITDLLENKLTKLDIVNNSISFEIKPFEIVTLSIK